jgi:hypothetical protein
MVPPAGPPSFNSARRFGVAQRTHSAGMNPAYAQLLFAEGTHGSPRGPALL